MDEALKARLIGAAVLVAVAVLLIPELLSGRKPVDSGAADGDAQRGTRTVIIDLAGGAARPAQPAEARTPATSAAVPSVGSEAAPPAAQQVAPTYEALAPPPDAAATNFASAEPVSTSPPPSPPAAAPPAVKGGWAVQVGAFGSAATANGLVRKLAADGYRAFVAPVQRGGKTLHRVRVGPEPDKAGAERLAGQLKAKDLPATVVQND